MAERTSEALHKLEEQLTCPICLDHYTEPKVLPCFHSFCLRCLASIQLELHGQQSDSSSNNSYSLPCPTCRSPCLLTQQGVNALPPAFTINNFAEVYNLLKKISGNRQASCDSCSNTDADRYCKQCAKFLCQQCLRQHNKWTNGHQTLCLEELVNIAHKLPQAKPDVTNNCTEHSKPLEIFCETCEEFICQLCTVKKHSGHDSNAVSDAYNEHKLKIESTILQPLNQQIDRLAEAVANLVKRRQEIVDQREKVKGEIHLEMARLRDLLDRTEKILNKQVDVALEYKLSVTDHQTKETEAVLDQLTECRDHVQQSLKVGTSHQILTTKSQLTSRSENLVDKAKDKTFQPLEQADIEFTNKGKIDDIITDIGKICYNGTSLSSVTSNYQYIPLVGQQSTISISLSLPDGTPAPVPSSLIRLGLSPPDSKGSIQCTLKESSSGQYNVNFTPNTRGVHQLHITIHDRIIPSGSPMSIPVSIPPKMRGTPVKTFGIGLKRPTCVAVTDDGQVIVCDHSSHCITVLDKEGKKMKSFDSYGKGKGQLLHPEDVAITSKRTVLVVDKGNCIQEFTMDGECVSCVGSKGNAPLQFNFPISIAINKTTGQVYVLEHYNHRVQVLNADLTFSHMFGDHGSGQGQFRFACGVGIDSQEFVYVADSENNRIQQFTPEGKFVSSFGTEGSEPGQLKYPHDVTVDDNGLLYVCEGSPNCRVSVFTTTGELVHCFGKGKIQYPYRSVFDKYGHLCVCDCNGDDIKMF